MKLSEQTHIPMVGDEEIYEWKRAFTKNAEEISGKFRHIRQMLKEKATSIQAEVELRVQEIVEEAMKTSTPATEEEAQHTVQAAKDESRHIIQAAKDESQHIIQAAKDESQHIIQAANEESQHIIQAAKDESQHIIQAANEEAESAMLKEEKRLVEFMERLKEELMATSEMA